jgi:uncharacterized membrane protein YdbT with pleckstrin-like domain
MQLQNGEKIIKIYHHHPFPFIIQVIKSIGASLPFFFLLYLFSNSMPYEGVIIGILIIIALFTAVIIYLALIYWLDKVVITNKRIVHIDWKVLSKRDEGEAMLSDVQDIHTKEKGIFSAIYLFDYGLLRIETAASKATIIFTEAPDPEGIKKFLSQHIEGCKPNTCEANSIPVPVTE